ncbi:Yip1 family protein [Pantoea sp. Mhis]|uniref:Yip1 family protein n=1 Tax=Pantoea sp. Mhis TaxID=2576759 RepID=UPI001358DD5D|nr:Yip1 family protein [Pantoea sp. Mhis]MXP56114.1 YIP1 family protein [Pantoea sp. Mhis]
MNHIWGLLTHPRQEIHDIKQQNESIFHHYTHHVLLIAGIPIICALIGTTQLGWNFGNEKYIKINLLTSISLGIILYLMLLAAVAIMGQIIYIMVNDCTNNNKLGLKQCIIFSGYVTTPLFISGIIALYPLVSLYLLVNMISLAYTGYLLYIGIPIFFTIDYNKKLRLFSSILAIGILAFEVLLALIIMLWSYGPSYFFNNN